MPVRHASRLATLAAPLLYLFVALYALSLCLSRPIHNWDMIGYIAAAKSFETSDPAALHAFTYDSLRRAVTPDEYQALTTGPFRAAVAASPDVLAEQIPFYRIRPLYNGLVYGLYRAGVDIGFATHLLAGLGVALALLLLFPAATSLLARPFLFALPPLAMIFGAFEVARLSTPDGLAYLAFVLAALLVVRRRFRGLYVLAPLCLGLRTDLILFTLPLLLLIAARERAQRRAALVAAVASVAAYVAIAVIWKAPGWATLLRFTFVSSDTHPLTAGGGVTAGQYAVILKEGLKSLLYKKPFLLYLLAAGYSLWLMLAGGGLRNALRSPSATLALAAMAFVAAHFLLFPVAWIRFFAAPQLVGALALLGLVSERMKTGPTESAGPAR